MNQLGISIEPAEIRLITSPDDPYAWRCLPEKQHLFSKHLSKHSVGAYRELCREIGVSFEAVRAPAQSHAKKEGNNDANVRDLSVGEARFNLQADRYCYSAKLVSFL